jgi:hypothetical protein
VSLLDDATLAARLDRVRALAPATLLSSHLAPIPEPAIEPALRALSRAPSEDR